MPPLRKLIILSVSLLGIIVLFNLFGYHIINKKTEQNRLREMGEAISSNQQTFIQQAIRSISLLTIHHSFSPNQYKEQLIQIRQSLKRLDREQQELKTIVYNSQLSKNRNTQDLKNLLLSANSSYNEVVSNCSRLLVDSSRAYLYDRAYQRQLRVSEATYLKQMQSVTEAFRKMEFRLENDIRFVNNCIITSLILSLILLAALVIAPMFKQGIKNYQQLQASLLEIKKSEELLRSIIDSSPDFIFVQDLQLKYRMVNKAMAQSVGKQPEDFLGKTEIEIGIPAEIVMGNPVEGIRGLQAKSKEVLNTGKPLYVPEETVCIDGQQKVVTTTKAPLRNSKDEIWGVLGFIHDITDRVQAEKKVRESEEYYRYLFRSNPMPMWIYDLETYQFLEVNQMAIQHYGYSAEEFAAKTILDIRSEEEKYRLTEWFKNNKEAMPVHPERLWKHTKKNGEQIFVEILSQKIKYNNRDAMLVLSMDITKRIQLQNELVNEKIAHQKGIAKATIDVQEKERNEIGKELHDNVNQMLTSAKLHMEYMNNAGTDKDKHRELSIKLINTAIKEIRRLSKSLVPPTINDIGLIQSIYDLIEDVNMFQLLKVRFEHPGFAESLLDNGLKLTVFRIIQEQTTNILKYANATLAGVELYQKGNHLYLNISDNGQGANLFQNQKGIGLTNITNRADIYSGKVRIKSFPGKGFHVMVDFSLNKWQAPG